MKRINDTSHCDISSVTNENFETAELWNEIKLNSILAMRFKLNTIEAYSSIAHKST